MKLRIEKDWINKFDHNEDEPGETIPIGPVLKLCGCKENPVIPESNFCYECFEAYNGEDEI